ncbi:diguanylate cyclase [Pseudomonas sp. Snoq117.2]|uniref:sensor domain-containing diguanylate cyclase n=1 Tax=Pseudomonas sp. Snoq117.2 TaxID=1500302 RepID=UPI0008D0B1BC|nr:diguanylate cyclase [Pseudomonas sp. Snoq117.2]SEP11129.1 diguanylate cyclase (GGDEF) domain-containing protein [Pseudomonas sp. Snoq117.2]
MKKLNETRRRLRIVLASAALVFIGIGGSVYYGVGRVLEDSKQVAHTQEVIVKINQVHVELLSAMAGARAYMINGSVEQHKIYLLSSSMLQEYEKKLLDLVSDNPEQIKNVEALFSLIDARMKQLEYTVAGYEAGGIEGAKAAISPNSMETHRAIGDHIASMVNLEHRLLDIRIDATNESAFLLLLYAIAGIPVGLLMVGWVYFILNRELTRRTFAENETAKLNCELGSTVSALESKSSDLSAIGEFAGYLQSSESIEEVLKITKSLFDKVIPGAAVEVYLSKPSQNYLELKTQWGSVSDQSAQVIYPSECWCLRRGKDHYSTRSGGSPICKHIIRSGTDATVALCMSLSSTGGLLGIISIQGNEGLLQARHSILGLATEQLSVSINAMQLRETLKYHSTRDELTGLYNRRYLEEAFGQLHARSVRHGQPYSILMIDIDHFKKLNDSLGHAAGDAALKEIGGVLSTMRSEDIVCRFGGEELIIAMPETDANEAAVVAERIRQKIERLEIDFQGVSLPPLTVSIGIASFPKDGSDNHVIRRNADLALYRAKREGRNRTVQYEASTEMPPSE